MGNALLNQYSCIHFEFSFVHVAAPIGKYVYKLQYIAFQLRSIVLLKIYKKKIKEK